MPSSAVSEHNQHIIDILGLTSLMIIVQPLYFITTQKVQVNKFGLDGTERKILEAEVNSIAKFVRRLNWLHYDHRLYPDTKTLILIISGL